MENEMKTFESENNECCIVLGIDIVESAVNDFVKAWQKGDYKTYRECEKFLNSDRVELFTLGRYNGKAIYEKLVKRCYNKYGQFVRQ